MSWVLTTVADDEAVLFDGFEVERLTGLAPAQRYESHGVCFETLARPPGERLATVATVNDVHFGEVVAGHIEGLDVGPVMRAAEGEPPYPEVMNRAAVEEIVRIAPDVVVAKGDLTAAGTAAEFEAFERCYRDVFGSRLWITRGNHDNKLPAPAFECPPYQSVDVPGASLAILDTSRPGEGGGRLSFEQLSWLEELAKRSTVPVMVLGHHPAWLPGSDEYMGEGACLDPGSSADLVDLAARCQSIAGYFAGHTHRNKVRRFARSGAVPFVEVACVKDFPGSWAEYRIFEGGLLQIHHRISAREALEWSEGCRAMVFGLYPKYAFGTIEDRCFGISPRS